MAMANFEITLQELQAFRSKLFEIDNEDESSKEILQGILDNYHEDNFEPFAEEYLITGFDIEILNEEARTKLKQLSPDGELPSIRKEDAKFWDRDRLLFCLMFDNEEAFAKGLSLITKKKPQEINKLSDEIKGDDKSLSSNEIETEDVEVLKAWRDVSLTKVAAMRELDLSIEQLGALTFEINSSAVRLVTEFGNWKPLLKLLKTRKSMMWKPVKLSDYISFLIEVQTFNKDFNYNDGGKADFGKCVDIMFKYAQFDINEQNEDNYSALHLAVMYNKTKIINELLKDGAYIGMLDSHDRPAIWNINPKTLEKYFDHCITGDDLIVFNFENLISPSDDYSNDMAAIEYMSHTNDLKYLLEHPLIASFLFLKWIRLALIFYLDFLCYSLLAIIIGCISLHYIKDPPNVSFKMSFFSLLFIMYTTLRRTLQIIFCSPNYRKSWENIVNCLLTLSIMVFLILFVISVGLSLFYASLAAISIILITYEFFTLAGTFWHFSIYSEMFIAVLLSTLKSMQLYAIFLPAFSLLFYILLGDPKMNYSDTEPDLNKFPSVGSSVLKTIVMTAGEFDVINVKFDANIISIYVFIGFLFLISTVFMNLMNGLAVSDTNKIQTKARLTSFQRRSLLIARYEEVLSNHNHWFRTRYGCMWKICKYFTHLNTFVYRDKRIYIELDGTRKVYSVKKMPSHLICLRVPLRSWSRIRTARMSSEIIRNALNIREKSEVEKLRNTESNEREHLMNRIDKLECTLQTMEDMLKTITYKLNESCKNT